MILRAIDIIIQQSFNLKIEKKFTLDFSRVPLEIAMTEYGGPGENDANIDFLFKATLCPAMRLFYCWLEGR